MIPEIRIPITVGSSNNDFQVDVGGGWLTATAGSATWDPYLLGGYSAAGAPNDCEEAAIAAAGGVFAFTYASDGATRGKWTWTRNGGGTFALGDATEDLISYFGFTQASYAPAVSQVSDVPCPYIFTPLYGLRPQPGAQPSGYDVDETDGEVEQTISSSGHVQTIASTAEFGIRTITFTCLQEYDLEWLKRVWQLLRDGRFFKFLQNRTDNTAYSATNLDGYLYLQLDKESCAKWQPRQTYPGTPFWFDVTFKCRSYVAP